MGKTCFVICPIGDKGTTDRTFSDLTFNYIIKPVVKNHGYSVDRADIMGKTGTIMPHVVKQILDSDLVIADLTNSNPNVFYELAIRHITERPCIQMIKDGQKIPFDIQGIETIPLGIDLANAAYAKDRLEKQIELIEKGEFNTTNPITSVHTHPLIQRFLKESKRDLQDKEILFSIFEIVNNLTYETRGIQSEISSLKEFRRLDPSFNDSDLKGNLDSIDQDLFLLTNIYNILNRNVEKVAERVEPGEAWKLNEAMAERGVIENRIEVLKNLKGELEKRYR